LRRTKKIKKFAAHLLQNKVPLKTINVPVSGVGFPWFGNLQYVDVWGIAQRNSFLRGMTVVACRDAGFPKRYQQGSLVFV